MSYVFFGPGEKIPVLETCFDKGATQSEENQM
jgi:hypothetical protein